MAGIILGRISPELVYKYKWDWRQYLGLDTISGQHKLKVGADAFYEPDYGLIGVAYSWHLLRAYSLRERDIQLAFNTIQIGLRDYDPAVQTDSAFLKELILGIAHAFACVGISPEIRDDAPWLCIALMRLQGHHMTVASVGGLDVHVFRGNKYGQLIESNQMSQSTRWALTDSVVAPSEIDSRDVMVAPGDLIVLATDSMRETIVSAELGKFSKIGVCSDPGVVNQHLLDTLKAQPGRYDDPTRNELPGAYTDYYIRGFGAAWAVVCVGE